VKMREHRLVIVGLLALATAGACSNPPSSSPSQLAPSSSNFELDIQNLDGPPVSVTINNKVVVEKSVSYLISTSPVPVFSPGPGLPLPWKVEVVKADGSVMGSWTETGDGGQRQIVIRGNQAWESSADQPPGPVPVSCPS
jgi:hypothetical protein